MNRVIDFINTKDIKKNEIFLQLKCSYQEAIFLQYILKEYLLGNDNLVVVDILSQFYDIDKYEHLKSLYLIRNLLELGWLVQNSFNKLKLNTISNLELLSLTLRVNNSFLKLLENGACDFSLPKLEEYSDHLQYLQDQFSKIDLAQKIYKVKQNFDGKSANIEMLQSQMLSLDDRIKNRVKKTSNNIMIEDFFKEYHLIEEEKLLFLALLKEEYSSSDESIRDMNSLIELISNSDYEKIKNRSLLEESSNLVSNGLIDYDEMIMPFGGLNRNFFIPEDILYKISHPKAKKSRKIKIKIQSAIKEQNIFELIHTYKSLDDIVLNVKTKEILDALLKQVDKKVFTRLKEWGIRDKSKGIEAKIIFYGLPGTGKTITSLALAKSLKKQVLSFDCSKILSMYIGQSEKNVRNIFDQYKKISIKTKSEPILLLNEADQFLSSRVSSSMNGSEKMYNQMQNIFLEQIEKFDGILIATTNLIENLDKAFSRRFNYKIEFTKPNIEQRKSLWNKLLPLNLPVKSSLDINKLSSYSLTGGQIELIIKNTAFKIAIKDQAIFSTEDFIDQIDKELKSMFDKENKMGFFN
jgi:SpoVK/Ycf46/Vps4 family AAA+-type ATPase